MKVRIVFGLALMLCAFAFSFNDDSGLAPPLVIGFLGGIFKAIGGVARKIGSVAKKVAIGIPGVGTVIAGGITAVEALLGGGRVTAETAGGARTTIVTPGARAPVQAGFLDQMMALKIAGLPVIPIVAGGAALWFVMSRKR